MSPILFLLTQASSHKGMVLILLKTEDRLVSYLRIQNNNYENDKSLMSWATVSKRTQDRPRFFDDQGLGAYLYSSTEVPSFSINLEKINTKMLTSSLDCV